MPIAKKTGKNQITLPQSIAARFPGVSYFDVREDEGRIVLRPVRPDAANDVRKKLAALKLSERDIAAAVRWARKR